MISPTPQDRWQPIETAPKDGTPVLLWSTAFEDTLGVVVGQWTEASSAAGRNGWMGSDFDMAGWEPEDQPTHWMPLPEPPAP